MAHTLPLRNGEAAGTDEAPELAAGELREAVARATRSGERLVALFGQPAAEGAIRLWAILARDPAGTLSVSFTEVRDRYAAITNECPQAHWFEREIAEQYGVAPVGHPWLKPIRFHAPWPEARGRDVWGRAPGSEILPAVSPQFQVSGTAIHEVAVGPVHAGIIEPGHFRFQCAGERVLHLEITLGFQHRGVERALAGGPTKRSIHYMETLAGDTTVGHATAYCQAVEALSGCRVPARAEALRAVALELERLANHAGDLGALATDVGFLPTASFCGRLRGDFLNMTGLVCGSRFGRGWVRPGGVAFDVDDALLAELRTRLAAAMKDLTGAAGLLFDSASVLARFEETGRVSAEDCRDLGLVGPAARACGAGRDVRFDFPSGAYRFSHIPVATWHTGDVFARAWVRWLEAQGSADFVKSQLDALPAGPVRAAVGPLRPDEIVATLVEGWRGEICHVAITDPEGRFARYKVTDPSFHNWMGLAIALRDQEISDFPLCNKSFNLSYCGHDL